MTPYKDNDPAIDDLLVKYLLRESNADEHTQVEHWIEASVDHQQYFENFKQIWQSSEPKEVIDFPDEQEAWNRFQQRIQKESMQFHSPARRFSMKRVFAAASILLFLIAGSWMLYRQLRPISGPLTVFTTADNIRTETLPDGTTITLNKNSKFSYPAQFSGKTRTVRLKGEAFFDVAQEKNHPFIVQVNGITVTVLGTAFNVHATDKTTEVIVESGMVKVEDKKNSLQLKAHEKVMVTGKKDILEKQAVDNELYNYYRTREFICNRTPLKELVSALNEAYDKEIVITNPGLEDLPLTTTFHQDQPLDSILSIITQTFNQVTFTQQGKKIILK